MKKTDFELLQPVEYHNLTGYITFISEYYISICFIDRPLPEEEHSRWGRYYTNIVVYPPYWHEIRSRLDEVKEEESESPRSDLLQFGRRRSMGAAHKQNRTCKN
jgi:hypothetical protein